MAPKGNWQEVVISGMPAQLNGLDNRDRLRIVEGTNSFKVQRGIGTGGSWVEWSNSDCVIKLSGTLTNGSTFSIKLKRVNSEWKHEGASPEDPITGATWTADEGP